MTFSRECRKILARGGVLSLFSVAVLIVALNQWGAHMRLASQRGQLAELEGAIMRALERGDVTRAEVQGDLQRLAEQEVFLADESRMLAFPRSIQVAFQSLASVGSLPMALAAALVFGSEFAWGTYRTLIAGGQRRPAILWYQYAAFCGVSVAVIAVSAIVAGSISVARGGGAWQPGGWAGLAASLGAVAIAIALWAALGLVSAVLTGSAGGAVTVVAMTWVAGYFMSFLGPNVRAWSPAQLVVELAVLGASKSLTSPFLLVSGVDTQGVGAMRAALSLTGMALIAVMAATIRFARQDIR